MYRKFSNPDLPRKFVAKVEEQYPFVDLGSTRKYADIRTAVVICLVRKIEIIKGKHFICDAVKRNRNYIIGAVKKHKALYEVDSEYKAVFEQIKSIYKLWVKIEKL